MAAALALTAGAVSASAAGSSGPLTCLEGFVWRQATPSDHVCVTPEVHAQAARDNALKATRRSTTSGTFGPDLYVAGFVWREAVPGDRVCVTPATWQQVHDDNRTAGQRRDALRVSIETYLPEPACVVHRCADKRAPTPRYWVRADGINVGMARVGLFWSDGARPALSWRARARRRSSGFGGVVSFKTTLRVCGTHPNAIIRVRDPLSLRWSSARAIATGCKGP